MSRHPRPRPHRAIAAHGARPGWRRWFPALVGLALLLLAPALTHAQTANPDSVSLSWTAPGDDSLTGTATSYDLRYATSPITIDNWSTATIVTSVPAPLPAGSSQTTTVHGLTYGTAYYFAIRSVDDAGNWSGLSNVVMWDWQLDLSPPTVPAGLHAGRSGKTINLTWSPDPDADLLGYSVYRATASGGPFTKVSGAVFPGTSWSDVNVPTNVKAVWYAVTATDVSGNESAKSTALQVTLKGSTALALGPVYPNPSSGAGDVSIPLDVPDSMTDATLVIVDATGRRVRTLQLHGLVAGPVNATWDGRGEDGRVTPPGVYRAMVLSASGRTSVRLVRL